jgi:hypothetical protein
MNPTPNAATCRECEDGPVTTPMLGRRDFIRTVGALALGTAVATPKARARSKAAEASEDLVRELFVTLSGEQKKKLLLPYNHGLPANGKGTPTRLNTYNGPINKLVLGDEYTKAQVDLVGRIFRSLGNGDEGFRQLSRGGTFDASGSFENISALFFGDPTSKEKFSFVFAGHHLTIRCDGNSEEAAAFGGPLYYGHTPNGYSDKNVFYHQTKIADELFRTITADQKKKGVVPDGKWMDGIASVKLPPKAHAPKGLAYSAMTKEQREMTEKVMRALVAPYRKEDGDEVMDIIKANGGMEKLALAFYTDGETKDKNWSYWRLEGPGFVWSYRALPHIHTFVNISSKL